MRRFFRQYGRLVLALAAVLALCAALPALYAIPARERLGWAKYAAAEEYAANYEQVYAEMDSQIADLVKKAGEDV